MNNLKNDILSKSHLGKLHLSFKNGRDGDVIRRSIMENCTKSEAKTYKILTNNF